ncbi:LicD family protein [Clostridium perfringens]
MDELEKIKQVEYNILEDFDGVCKKLNIRYTLAYGTLLGAVRHKGFIPWDDDIDVAMLREDYDIFLEKGQELLKENYFLQTYETDKNYLGNFAKIRDMSTNLIEYTTQSLNSKSGIYIDIFPIERVCSNKIINKLDILLYSIIYIVKNSATIELAYNSKSKIKKILHLILFPLAKIIGVQRLNRIETYIKAKNSNIKNRNKNNNVYVMDPKPFKFNNSLSISVEKFLEFTEIEFEKGKFQTIMDYDLFLNKCYGEYMKLPPIEEQKSNHKFIKVEFLK